MTLEQGLVHVYTGDAKGKTTAAFGLACRAAGHGLRVLFAQFFKGGVSESGEAGIARKVPNLTVQRFDQVHPLFSGGGDEESLKATIRRDFEQVTTLVLSGAYDVVVLDEINNVVAQGWMEMEPLLALIESRPVNVELVLTGRAAPGEIVAAADYVTEMRMVKHPFRDAGIAARKGIEY